MKYTAFFPDVKPHLKSDPSDPVVENAIKNAAISFCRESLVWREYMDPISVEAGVAQYDLELPAGSDVVTVMSVKLDGITIDPESLDTLDTQHVRWDSDTGVPKRYSQTTTGDIILSPVPDANYTDSLVIGLVLMPSRSATSMPNWIASQYWEGIAAGAISRLMLMPSKGWTDLAVGADKRAEYDKAVAAAREAGARSLGRARVRVRGQH